MRKVELLARELQNFSPPPNPRDKFTVLDGGKNEERERSGVDQEVLRRRLDETFASLTKVAEALHKQDQQVAKTSIEDTRERLIRMADAIGEENDQREADWLKKWKDVTGQE